jgi:hypothetical protein
MTSVPEEKDTDETQRAVCRTEHDMAGHRRRCEASRRLPTHSGRRDLLSYRELADNIERSP